MNVIKFTLEESIYHNVNITETEESIVKNIYQ